MGTVTADNSEDASYNSEAAVEEQKRDMKQADVILNIDDAGSTKPDKKKKKKKKRKIMNDTQNGGTCCCLLFPPGFKSVTSFIFVSVISSISIGDFTDCSDNGWSIFSMYAKMFYFPEESNHSTASISTRPGCQSCSRVKPL